MNVNFSACNDVTRLGRARWERSCANLKALRSTPPIQLDPEISSKAEKSAILSSWEKFNREQKIRNEDFWKFFWLIFTRKRNTSFQRALGTKLENCWSSFYDEKGIGFCLNLILLITFSHNFNVKLRLSSYQFYIELRNNEID